MKKNIRILTLIKKSALFGIAGIIAGSAAMAQQKAVENGTVLVKYEPVTTDVQPTSSQAVGKGTFKSTNQKSLGERVLGVTTYDLQTNNSVHDRVARDTAGNMSVVWTASLQNNSTWTDRGAGYSHYDPTSNSWTISPSYPRIESDRCGWPSILYDGDGGEIIVSHSTDSKKLKLNYRSKIGDNSVSWSEKNISTGNRNWNRAAIGGPDGNTLHIVATVDRPDSASFQNIAYGLVYYRSQDAGLTFDVFEKILPGLDSASVGTGFVLSNDASSIVARGNHVAIGVFNSWNDVILLESFDNGTTWTSKVVWDFPYKGFNDFWNNYDTTGLGAAAFIEACDASGSIIIDDNDVVHMTWGRMKVINAPDQKNSYVRRTFVDSLRYYRNSTSPYLGFAGNWVDANQDSMFLNTASYYGLQYGSIVTYPNLAVSNDSIYLIYAGITDSISSGVSPGTRLHHIFLVRSGDNGLTWSQPIDLTPYGQFDECIYGDIFPVVDDKIRLIYQRDAYPSVYVSYASQTTPSTNYTWQQSPSDNDIVYLEITLDGTGIGIGLEKVLNQSNESGISPNPSNGLVNLNLILYRDMDVDITVHSMSGQVVYTYNGDVQKGRNDIRMDLTNLQPGMYVVNIKADGEVLTEKVIIE